MQTFFGFSDLLGNVYINFENLVSFNNFDHAVTGISPTTDLFLFSQLCSYGLFFFSIYLIVDYYNIIYNVVAIAEKRFIVFIKYEHKSRIYTINQ